MFTKHTVRRALFMTMLTSMGLLFVSCGPAQLRVSPSDVANFHPDRTIIFADGSGVNTFLLIVPDSPNCELAPLEATFESLKSAFGQMTYYHYAENGNAGFVTTHRFCKLPVHMALIIVFHGLMLYLAAAYLAFFNRFELFRHIYG